MAVRIGSNIASLQAQRALATSATNLGDIYEKLSSGQRINSASDDAAGLAISSGLNFDSRVFAQAIRNVNDGISALSIAQEGLTQLSGITIRQKELAEQAANGSLSASQRSALNQEAAGLTEEYNRIVQTTKFNGIRLYQDDVTNLSIQSGKAADNLLSFDIGTGLGGEVAATTSLDILSGSVEIASISFAGFQGAESFDIEITADYDGTGGSDYSSRTIDLDGLSIGFDADGDPNYYGDIQISLTGYTTAADVAAAIVSQFSSVDYTAEIVSGATVRFTSTDNLANLNSPNVPPELGNLVGNDHNGAYSYISFGEYFTFSTQLQDYYFYYNSDPGLGGYTGIAFTGDVMTLDTAGLISQTATDINSAVITGLTAYQNGDSLDIQMTGIGDVGDVTSYLGQNYYPPVTNILQGTMNVDPTFDTITSNSHGFVSGDLIRFESSDGIPGGLNTATDYYVIKISDNYFKLASSYADAMSATAIDITSTGTGNQNFTADLGGTVLSVQIADIDLTSASSAREALDTLESRLQNIALETGRQGAFQSRLDVAVQGLQSGRENYLAAASRITDADVAAESANLIRNQIIQSAAASVLAQANQQPGLAISLLGNL